MAEGRLNSKMCHACWSFMMYVVDKRTGKDLIDSGEKKAQWGELASVKTTSFSKSFV
jgi:hypothetical protein